MMQVIRPRTGNSSSRTSWLIPARVDEPEWLDNHLGSPEDVRANFADMWRINRYLGGLRALTAHLYPRLRVHKGITTLADLGTGSAEIPVTIARWARGEGLNVQILALDLSARNLAISIPNNINISYQTGAGERPLFALCERRLSDVLPFFASLHAGTGN